MNAITRLTTQFLSWIGPVRARLLFFLLAVTGLVSLILNSVNVRQNAWVPAVQSGSLIVFLIGAALVIGTRLPNDQRLRAAVIVVPSIIAFSLATLLPNLWLLFVPFGVGWVIIAYLASQARVRREYQAAIKHLRKSEYDEAIKVMSALIEEEPNDPDHYHFRASLFRMNNKLKRARADYQKIIDLLPDSGVGYNGLAEVFLQDGEYDEALPFARKAYQMEPENWVAPYNLGMIEDRIGQTADAITHLQDALRVKIPESRHRLLTHFWLARAYSRQNQKSEAESELDALRREKSGLSEWKTVFESEQAIVLMTFLGLDVALAEGLITGEIGLDDLSAQPRP